MSQIASKDGKLFTDSLCRSTKRNHQKPKFMSHEFSGPLKLLITRNFLSKAPLHLCTFRIFQCHGANDEVVDKGDKHGKPILQRLSNIFMNQMTFRHPKTCEKTPFLVVQLFESSTSMFLQTQQEKCERLTRSYSEPSNNLCLCQ